MDATHARQTPRREAPPAHLDLPSGRLYSDRRHRHRGVGLLLAHPRLGNRHQPHHPLADEVLVGGRLLHAPTVRPQAVFVTFFTLRAGAGHRRGAWTDNSLFDNFDIGNPPPTEAAPPPTDVVVIPAPTPEAPVGGGATDGPGIFVSRGCGGCHVIEGLAGAVGVTGPEMTGIGSRAGTRVAGLSAEDYIRQSVEEPEAFVLEGYDNVMQPLRGMMTDEEFDILVEYLLTLQ